MALVRCRECAKQVSSSAKTCPHCGIAKPAPLEPIDMAIGKPMKTFLKFLLYCFVGIFVIAAVMPYLQKDKQNIAVVLVILIVWGGILFIALKKWRAWRSAKDQVSDGSPASPKAKKETAIGAMIVIGIFVVALLLFGSSSDKQQTGGNQAADRQSYEDIDNSCFIAGQSLATVYVANMSQLSSADLMPSQVMEEGCSKKGDTVQDKQRCINLCKLGFRRVAREVMK